MGRVRVAMPSFYVCLFATGLKKARAEGKKCHAETMFLSIFFFHLFFLEVLAAPFLERTRRNVQWRRPHVCSRDGNKWLRAEEFGAFEAQD